MKHRSIDVLIVAALALVAGALAFFTPSNWLPIRILALLLVFILPGYALTSALLPQRPLGVPERLVFSLGLSLSAVMLGGLLLNLIPLGLNTSSWAVYLVSLTVVASAIAFIRQRRQSLPNQEPSRVGHISFTFGQGLLLGLATLVVGAAVGLSIEGAQRQVRPGFTQLWILSANGTPHAKNTVRLGVSNMEATGMEYHLIVNMDGKVIKDWPSLDLAQNRQWETALALPPTGHTGVARVEAMLYRTDVPTKIYRDVVLWFAIT